MISLLIATAFLCGALGLPLDGTRIIGGDDAKLGEFPYLVSVRLHHVHACGGSILNENAVLTAAHCVYEWEKYPFAFSIQYGTLNLTEKSNVVQVNGLTRHEKYVNSAGYNNDIAILKLAAPIKFSDVVHAVELPAASEVPKGTAVLAGWGSSKAGSGNTNRLQRVDFDVIDDKVCKDNEILFNPKYHMCAGDLDGGKAQCSGDSGGPLVVQGKQFGIVSWSHKPCGTPGHAGVLTKVVNYLQWIKEKLNK